MKMVGFRVPNCLIVLVIILLVKLRSSTLVVGQNQQQVTVLSERFALIQLRSLLGIRARDWPIKSDPCLVWKGIQCVNGSVVGVNVSGFRRTRVGAQNPQFSVDPLANLTQLASFNASNFALPGQIPDLFGQSLGNLQQLDLHSCNIKGAIPFSLGNLTRLNVLVLSQNELIGIIPPIWGQLVNLSVLDLSRNKLMGSIPASFSSLKSISFLDLSSNFISGSIPPGIGILSNLRSLNFSHNMLMSDIPPQLGDLKALADLDLSFNALMSTLPPDLRGLRSLRTMMIGNNKLSGQLPNGLFTGLTELQVVVLSHNNFSGDVPDELWRMPTLRLVDVSGNKFTGILPNVTFDANAATSAILNLSDNKYYGGLSVALQRFNSIDLNGNYFEGKVPDFLRGSTSFDVNCLQNATSQRSVSECESFYASKGEVFDNFGLPRTNVTPTAGQVPSKSSHKRTILLAAILGGVGLLLLALLVFFIILCARKNRGTRQRSIGVGPTPPIGAGPPSPGVSINFTSLGDSFTYQQLLQAAGNFSDANLIKNGHSGDLFRGVLEGGIPVVIKRINLNTVKRESYLAELDFFSKVAHPRLVPLLGYCLQEDEKYLVYKHMPNSDLANSLYRKINPDDDNLQSLDWITRSKIAIGAAEGLSYLHHECEPPFVHRDVQASSILLDDKFEVRLGSLSDVHVQEGDAQPGVITRFLRLPQNSEQGPSGSQASTCAYDVYCFGKVLLELITGKLGISASNDTSTKEWLDQTLSYINIYDKDHVTKIVDPTLIYDEDLLEEVWAMAIVARSCLNPKPSRRPLMRYILKALENPLKVVREDNTGSARLRTTSSRGSWNASVFGSWRQSLDVGPVPTTLAPHMEGTSSLKRSETSGSQGSAHIIAGVHNSSSQPVNGQNVERHVKE